MNALAQSKNTTKPQPQSKILAPEKIQKRKQIDLTGIPIKGGTTHEQTTNFVKKIVASYGPISLPSIAEAVILRSQDQRSNNLIQSPTLEQTTEHVNEVAVEVQNLWLI